MRKLAFILLALPSLGWGMTYWSGDGGYKVPQEDLPPATTNYTWHDSAIYIKAARNETAGFVFGLGNDTASDIQHVSVTISSFTGTGGSIVSVAVSSGNVWDTTTRPIEQFQVGYLPIDGTSKLTWDQYDQRHAPSRFRLPCTMSGGQCTANGGTVWADRPDHNKNYPDILYPQEIMPSSFTVYASSSQLTWFDVYVSTNLAAGSYTAYVRVYVDGSLTQTIPVYLTVRDFTLTETPAFKVIAYVGSADISERMNGERWPADHQAEPYYTSRARFNQMLHRHGIIPMTDDRVSSDTPYPMDVARLNGTLYSPSLGYGNARGVNTGDTVYTVGVYGTWQSAWGTTCSAIKSHITNWTTYFANNYPNVLAFWYTMDETMTNAETYAACASTITVSGYKTNIFITSNYPDVMSGAPSINMPCATGWIGTSSATYAAANTYYQQGLIAGTTQGWAYNGKAPWQGTDATEDDGVAPLTVAWGDAKMGIPGHLIWAVAYYNNYQGGMGNTNVFANAQTFGGYSSTDSQLGHTGWNYTNGDGLWMYPGTDLVFSTVSKSVNAPFSSWRMKMMRRGIQDADYISMARQANLSAANVIVSSAVPSILYEVYCYDPADCSYSRTPRSWSDNPDDWQTNRDALAALIPSDGGSPYCGDDICNGSDTCSNCPQDCGVCPSGQVQFKGNFRFTGFNGRFQ